MARYDTTNSSPVRARPLASAHFKTAGAAPGSIIAAIIGPHIATKNVNEPSGVATPMSIPFICQTATTQDAAASPSVAVSAVAAAAVLVLVMAVLFRGGPPNPRPLGPPWGGARPPVQPPEALPAPGLNGEGG